MAGEWDAFPTAGAAWDAFPAVTPQMTGVAREIALPASNVAKGLISAAGLPGDLLRGAGYLTGQAAEQSLNPDPLSAARDTPTAFGMQPPQIITPQNLADVPGKPNVAAPSLHNPIDTQSLMAIPQAMGLVDRPDLQPQSARERFEAAGAQGVGAVLPMLATGGLSLPAVLKTAAQGAVGGVGGEGGGMVGEAIGGAPGRVVGSLLGATLTGTVAPRSIGGAGPGALIPRGLDAGTEALAENAAQRGINVSVGQVSENPFVKYLDSFARRMPFSGYGAYDKANQAAVNRNVAAAFGETADKVTPEVLDAAYTRIGTGMNDIAKRSHAPLDPQMDQELTDIVRKAGEAGLDQGQVNAIAAQAQKLRDIAAQNNGIIPGQVYQNLTKRGESLDLLQGTRSTVSGNLGGQIRDALDSALERGSSPADVAKLRELRTQYKAMKTVEPLTMGADSPTGGPTPSTGDINPVTLLGRVKQQYSSAARAPLGQIDLKDVAQIGQRFLKEAGSSGTAERVGIGRLGELGAGVAGAGHIGGYPLTTTVPPLLMALMAPHVVGSVLRTPALRPSTAPLAAALMGAYPRLGAPNEAGP